MHPDAEMIKALMALGPDEPATPINGCDCDFCSRRKKHEDNWCPWCAQVKMLPPKHWENYDACNACEEKMKREEAKEQEARSHDQPA